MLECHKRQGSAVVGDAGLRAEFCCLLGRFKRTGPIAMVRV
jgi:hypothetical protein